MASFTVFSSTKNGASVEELPNPRMVAVDADEDAKQTAIAVMGTSDPVTTDERESAESVWLEAEANCVTRLLFLSVALIVGLLAAVLCVACLALPDLSAQYPTGSLDAVACAWTPETPHLVAR
jgi:hypothetical protein